MGQSLILKRGDRQELRLELRRRQVIISQFDEEVTQNFPSEEDAKSHFDRMLMLRSREGFVVEERHELGDVEDRGPAELLFWKTVDGADDEITLKLSAESFGDDEESEEHLVQILSVSVLQRAVSLTLERDPASEHSETENLPAVVRAFARMPLPNVRSLILIDDGKTFRLGDLAPLFTALPRLERAYLEGNLTEQTPFHHDRLEKLVIAGGADSQSLTAFLESSLPKLRKLELSLDDDETTDELVLSRLEASKWALEGLRVQGLREQTDALARILSAPLSKTLRDLALEGRCSQPRTTLSVLKKHEKRVASLKSLVLGMDDVLSGDDEQDAKKRFPQLADWDYEG